MSHGFDSRCQQVCAYAQLAGCFFLANARNLIRVVTGK